MELKGIVTVAVPAMATVLVVGLLWYTSRKKHKDEENKDKEEVGQVSVPKKVCPEEKDENDLKIDTKIDAHEESNMVEENSSVCLPLKVSLSPNSNLETSAVCQSSPTLPVSGEPENEFDTPEVATCNSISESVLTKGGSPVPVNEEVHSQTMESALERSPSKSIKLRHNELGCDTVDGGMSGVNGEASSHESGHSEHSDTSGCVGASSEVQIREEEFDSSANGGGMNGLNANNQIEKDSHTSNGVMSSGVGNSCDLVEGHLTNGQLASGDKTCVEEKAPEHNVTGHGDGNTHINTERNGDSRKDNSPRENKKHDPHDIIRYEFEFPSELCGRLIGKHGSTITAIKTKSDTEISLSRQSYNETFQICAIEGTKDNVDYALKLIRRKFPKNQFPNVDLRQLSTHVQEASPVLAPEMMQLTLPEGVMVDVIVSSIVNASHIFVQQPTHPTYPSLERLNQFMIMCYQHDGIVPQLPRPIEVGVICAAPMMDGWYRAQVVSVQDETDECDIKYVDYGGYARIQACALKQIRSDFMTLPFQACEAYLANITPLEGEESYSLEASAVLEEVSQGRMLQLQTLSAAADGIPYVQLYTQGAQGTLPILINRDLVDRGVVRWVENQENAQLAVRD
ncbi:A-kinase anchor protein 1, mitochondrial isoform X2 [Lingula anatina]|uniref:A-kinase anchor protein 1, mitochondrial isoform X2 n=1 Tax=Lingula anatina TaxID=7574 RepID=A0A1S3HE08_LINAN|nr:A-kinase anchor protein 1, mitochondrial isoform X2 [Lingula anatina]|eukprot:XP_013383304.1 A-kinase anchor protein 1, mitochondrial isoform X2 [Lingula anatina]